jgi:peptidoglycan-associated lipoprotein
MHTRVQKTNALRAFVAASAFVVLSALMSACGGCGPNYPDCKDDKNCASHREVCVDGKCKECRDDSQCNTQDVCMGCSGNACVREPGCCKSDLDCPAGGKCWKTAGQPSGTCGGACRANTDCPQGTRCSNGSCVPDIACSDDSFCPTGLKCIGGSCVAACDMAPVYFDFNEYSIRLDQESSLSANAECVKGAQMTIGIEGHCDERGSDEYNLALGQRRAAAVARQYITLGVERTKLRGILSYGEERPACNESNESCWRLNRRAESIRK